MGAITAPDLDHLADYTRPNILNTRQEVVGCIRVKLD